MNNELEFTYSLNYKYIYLNSSRIESCSISSFLPLTDFIVLTVIFASSLTFPTSKGYMI